jgi:hypothetical protein
MRDIARESIGLGLDAWEGCECKKQSAGERWFEEKTDRRNRLSYLS